MGGKRSDGGAAGQLRTATSFYRHDARGQLAEKFQHLSPPQRLAQNGPSCAVGSMHLEHSLRQIEPDRDSLVMTAPLCGSLQHPGTFDVTGGRSHHQRRANLL